MMLESGPIRLVRPSAVGITHKKWVPGETLENCIHKDRRRNVGCVHHRESRSRSILLSFKNARTGQSRALFELDFHTSCTGVLFRVTGLSKILLNRPVHDNCKSSKVGHQNPGWKHGFWQNYTNLRFQFSVVAIGTRVPVPGSNI